MDRKKIKEFLIIGLAAIPEKDKIKREYIQLGFLEGCLNVFRYFDHIDKKDHIEIMDEIYNEFGVKYN